LDLGIGRALTKSLAEKSNSSSSDNKDRACLIWTSLSLMFVFALAGTVAMILLTPLLVGRVLKVDNDIRPEAIHAFYWLSISLPFVITTSGLRGIFEARQRFDIASVLRIVIGALTFGAPLAVIPFSHGLVSLMAALVIGRILS